MAKIESFSNTSKFFRDYFQKLPQKILSSKSRMHFIGENVYFVGSMYFFSTKNLEHIPQFLIFATEN